MQHYSESENKAAADFTPCHSVKPVNLAWACELTFGGAFGVLTTDEVMPAARLGQSENSSKI
eukprot:7381711-Prymnesium_polylepis.2